MQLTSLSLPILLIIFTIAAGSIWWAGIRLSKTTDILTKRFHLGEALGGAVILAIVTNLPEIAITVSAALKGNMGLATGNILGGIALQTVVLVLLDGFGLSKKGALTFLASSMALLLEALSVVFILTLVVIGHQMPKDMSFMGVSPASVLIALVWVISLALVDKASKGLPWKLNASATDQQSNGGQQVSKKKKEGDKKKSTGSVFALFILCALITLVGGVGLEMSGDAIAKQIHVDGVVFGATILALATSLPEISTGLAAIKLGDHQLAMSDIFGGNAFLPVLFLLASVLAGKPPLPQAHRSDIYLTGVAMLLTIIYCCGVIFRSKKQIFRMGVDSLTVLIVYLIGIAGLFFISA